MKKRTYITLHAFISCLFFFCFLSLFFFAFWWPTLIIFFDFSNPKKKKKKKRGFSPSLNIPRSVCLVLTIYHLSICTLFISPISVYIYKIIDIKIWTKYRAIWLNRFKYIVWTFLLPFLNFCGKEFVIFLWGKISLEFIGVKFLLAVVFRTTTHCFCANKDWSQLIYIYIHKVIGFIM